MIDIHTHILPGVDDGAADWEETIALARAAAGEGITKLIATPHHANGKYENEAEGIRELTAIVNMRLMQEGISLTVLCGQEIRIHDGLLDAWSRKELITLAESNYLLVEMPSSSIPKGMADCVHELSVLGLRTIIAHPERNAEVVAHPDRYAELIEAGAYGQVTSHSLLGGFGRKIEQTAWSLCKAGLIHVVSSDAHHVARRSFRLADAYKRIEEEMGAEWVQYYQGNTESIVNYSPLLHQPERIKEKRKTIKSFISSIFHS